MRNLRQDKAFSRFEISASLVKAELTFLAGDEGREQRERKPRGPFYPRASIWLLPPDQPLLWWAVSHFGYLGCRDILGYLELLDIFPPHEVFFEQSEKRKSTKQGQGVTSGTANNGLSL